MAFERRKEFGLAAAAFFIALAAQPAAADSISVYVDQARLMKLPDRVTTVVIGNPLIADATLQAGGILVLTGKGYGSTNVLALDRTGRVLMDKTVTVIGPSSADLVVVYRGAARESYSCAPDCERRITLGDSPTYFDATIDQAEKRNGKAAAPK
jgi:hypothetical protein